VTFDECAGGTDNGCGAAVYTGVIGPKVVPHMVSNILYKHENTLRTILDALQITTYPGAAATASDMSDFFTTEGSKPEVTVSSPTDGASVSSPVKIQALSGSDCWPHDIRVVENVGAPVNIQALASPTAGHTISGWKIYVDGVRVYDAGAVNAIDTNVALSPSVHVLLVRAWDTSGAHGDQTLNLTIVSKPAVAVSVPAPGSNVISPINIQASATPTSGHRLGTNDVEKVLYTFEPVGGTRGGGSSGSLLLDAAGNFYGSGGGGTGCGYGGCGVIFELTP
jgi:hypothetical protein